MKQHLNQLVSVIVVAYQSEKYILDVLESVRVQRWDNIELIITDDGSTDNTTQICEDWIAQNNNRFTDIKLLTVAQNTGIPANCDRGLSASRGQWVKFIAADDLLLDNCLTDNMDIMQQFPEVSFIISDLIEISDEGEILRIAPKNQGLKYFMQNQTSKKEQLKAYARWPAFMNTPTFFYKREIIVDIFKPQKELRIFEDTSAIFKIIDNGANVFYLKKPTVKYRIHNHSISRDIKYDQIREKEAYIVYKKYRKEYLSIFNPIDLSVFYESWLRFKFKGIKGHKGILILKRFSLFYWYLKLNGIKQE